MDPKFSPEILKEAPLSAYERELIKLIDINGKTVSEVAKEKEKSKSTISIQHSRAYQKLEEFLKKAREANMEKSIASQVFKMLEKGKSLTEIVTELEVDPDVVLNLQRKWSKMKEVDLNNPNIPRTLKELQDKVEELDEWGNHTLIELIKLSPCLSSHLYEHFECKCGAVKQNFAFQVRCLKCGRHSWWSFEKDKWS